jgi:adenosylcobinamide-GDP ribazoletransferase
MRDPRTGSFGATALALLLLVEAAALAALAAEREVGPVVAAFALSRAVAPCTASLLPYARPGPGLGQALAGGSRPRAACAALLAIAIAAVLAPASAIGLIAAAAAIWAAGLLLCARRFGGVTGDTLGASIAISEAACLAVAAS